MSVPTNTTSRTNAHASLMNAVVHGKVRAVSGLLDAGADVNATDDVLMTPLMRAVYIAKEDVRTHIVRLLLTHGSEVNARDKNGRTVLMHAAFEENRQDVVRQLVRTKKCDPNARDRNGDTVLTYAVVRDNPSVIRILVNSAHTKSVINVNSKNKDKLSPLQIAVNLRHAECCQILVNEGGADTAEFVNQTILKKLLGEDSNATGTVTADVAAANAAVENATSRRMSENNANQDGDNSMSSHPSVRLEKISIHSHGSSSSGEDILENGDMTARKNDRRSYKSSMNKRLSGMANQILVQSSDMPMGGYYQNVELEQDEFSGDPRATKDSSSDRDKNPKVNVVRPLIYRPTDQLTRLPVMQYGDLDDSEVMETISNYSLSPRSDSYRKEHIDVSSLKFGSDADLSNKLFHRKRNSMLSPDTKQLADIRSKPQVAEQHNKSRSLQEHKTSTESLLSITNSNTPPESSSVDRIGERQIDHLHLRRHSFDNRISRSLQNEHDRNVFTSTNELTPVPRYPVRLQPLSPSRGSVVGNSNNPFSLPQL